MGFRSRPPLAFSSLQPDSPSARKQNRPGWTGGFPVQPVGSNPHPSAAHVDLHLVNVLAQVMDIMQVIGVDIMLLATGLLACGLRRSFPEFYHVIQSSGRQPPAIRTEGHAQHSTEVCLQREDLLTEHGIPHLHRLILAG